MVGDGRVDVSSRTTVGLHGAGVFFLHRFLFFLFFMFPLAVTIAADQTRAERDRNRKD